MNSNHTPNQSRIRRTVAAVLIVAVLVVAVGVFLVAQCLSFDGDGAHVIDRYGVLAQEAQQLESTGSAQPVEEQPQEETPVEQPEPEPEGTDRIVMLAASAVADEQDRILELAESGALDTVVVNIKDDEGNLNLSVDTNEIDEVEYLVDSDADALKEAIGALKEAGVHVIGRIYCLHDAQATDYNSDLAIQFENGGTWLDYDNTRWLDPTNDDTVSYLCDIAKSAAEAGCDELMLADFTFPPRGHLDRAEFDRDPDDQAAVLLDALEEIRHAAGDAAVSLTADSLSDLTDLSANGAEDGIPVGDVGALLDAADRLFVPVDGTDEADSLTDAIHELAENTVVVPVFYSGDAWIAYDGTAALNGVADSEGALDAAENRLTGSYDHSDHSDDSEEYNDSDEYSQEDDSDGYDDSDDTDDTDDSDDGYDDEE